jgi:hypothetical protein
MLSTETNPAAYPQPIIHTYLVGDLVCHLCGTTAGSIESERRPLPPTVRFTPVGASRPLALLDWRRLRCPRCRGGLFVENLDLVRRRVEPLNVFEEERPRRGRPPKWLVEKRRRERQLLEQPAA